MNAVTRFHPEHAVETLRVIGEITVPSDPGTTLSCERSTSRPLKYHR